MNDFHKFLWITIIQVSYLLFFLYFKNYVQVYSQFLFSTIYTSVTMNNYYLGFLFLTSKYCIVRKSDKKLTNHNFTFTSLS